MNMGSQKSNTATGQSRDRDPQTGHWESAPRFAAKNPQMGEDFAWPDICDERNGGMDCAISHASRAMKACISPLPLSAACLFLGLCTPARTQTVHFGSQDVYAAGGFPATAPVYLTNFDGMELDSIQFALSLFSAPVMGFAPAPFFAEGWTLDTTRNSSTHLRVGFRATGSGFSGEWTRLGEVAIGEPAPGAGFAVGVFSELAALTGILAHGTGSDSLVVRTTAPSGRGDVNADGRVDIADAQEAFQAVAAGEAEPLEARLEVSGVQPAGLYDVAILYRHTIGLLPALPEPPLPAATQPPENISIYPEFTISPPVELIPGFGLYSYTIGLSGMPGLLSGEFYLNLDASVIQSIQNVSLTPSSAQIQGMSENETSYRILAAFPRPLAANEPEWLTVVARHLPGQSQPGITGVWFDEASLNEGRLTVSAPTAVASKWNSGIRPMRVDGRRLVVPHPAPGAVLLLVNPKGIHLKSWPLPHGNPFELPLADLPPGGAWLVLREKGRHEVLAVPPEFR